ncbi:MAG TPA: fumarylacetoacetate hydrolase family protein [Acidobacteriaceae bacterium]|jgi:2-keto-4-pentenoate hydratase/2-oxohepta-3-ene-1,7-dioic acid hydratase in catechol pathway|nr:fumarylacetoacetate hydrolase family protein [Acidobacteriaceae bacterium]
MKLLNYYSEAGVKALGAVEGDRVYNLTSAGFATLGALLRGGDAALAKARELLKTPAQSVPLADVKHAPLVERDARVFCVGLNYADHAAENNLPPPSSPIFFSKLAAVVIPNKAGIPIPKSSQQVDYEAEFALVIGRRADCVNEADALACIAGYTIMNDVSARDFQFKDKQWFRGKNCNGFGPMGPWMVTADSVPDPLALDISLRLNGETLQHSNTRNLVFSPAALVSTLSQSLVLEPGDVISTGTPAGIGFHRKPQVFLKPGDRMEIEVSGIGILENFMLG